MVSAIPAVGKPCLPRLSPHLSALLVTSASLGAELRLWYGLHHTCPGGRGPWDWSDGAQGGTGFTSSCLEGLSDAWKKSDHLVRRTWMSESQEMKFLTCLPSDRPF